MLVLMVILAPCAYAGKVEYPTLYPSPNGEYANLYSTNDSYFATSSGNVGLGMTSGATVKLDVAQNNVIKVGQAYLSSGGATGNFAHLATNAWHNGTAWVENGAGVILQLAGATAVRVHHHDGGGTLTTWASVASTSGWIAGCAQALKQNIHALTFADYALLREQFRATDVFSYNRKDISAEPEVGFIAEHAPDLILDKTKTGIPLIKGIGYLAAVMKAQENILVPLEDEARGLKQEVLASGAEQRQIEALQREVEELKKEFA